MIRYALAAIALLLAMPAAAAPNFIMRGADRIDLVRDLPNDETFERDGQYYDLGYLYSTERINGADVATSNQGFVLYHDDRYAKLDSGVLADITLALGEDPTEGYVPPARTTAPVGSKVDYDAPAPFRSAAAPAGSPSTRQRHSGGWLAVIPAFLLLVAVRWARRMLIRGAIDLAFNRREKPAPAPEPARPDEDMFARAAAQRARLDALTAAPSPAAPRGFGRKVA